MTRNKLNIRLTDDQQKQIKDATGKHLSKLTITSHGPSALSEQDLDKVVGGKVTGGTNLFEIEDYSFD